MKEEVFPDEEHMTTKRIREKVVNMKTACSKAKATLTTTGWGLKAEDNEPSINARLESRCLFFWRLDAIWGTRPNATPIVVEDTTNAQLPVPATPATLATPATPATVISVTPKPTTPTRGLKSELADSAEDVLLESDSDSSIRMTTPKVRKAKPQKVKRERDKQDRMGSLKRILEDRSVAQTDGSHKKMKLRKEMEQQGLDAEDRRLDKQIIIEEKRFERQIESNEKIAQIQSHTAAEVARIQAEAQTRQLETLANLIGKLQDKA